MIAGPARLSEIVQDFASMPGRAERIDALISISKEFENPSPEEFPRSESARVPGCESEVFIVQERTENGLAFRIAVDNPQGISAMALARILQDGTSEATAAEISKISDSIVFDIFGSELSMGKSLGLTGMVRMVAALAARAAR